MESGITLKDLDFITSSKKKAKVHPPSLWHPPIRTGLVDYQNPKKNSPVSKEKQANKEQNSDTKQSENKIPEQKFKKPRKLSQIKEKQEIIFENNYFIPSKIPNFFIKGKEPPKFGDFDEKWEEYLEMKELDRVRNSIYFAVFYKKWKRAYSMHFVQKVRSKSSVLATKTSTPRSPTQSEPNSLEIDTIELLERARKTIDELTSSSSRSKSLTINRNQQTIGTYNQAQEQSSAYSRNTYSQYSDFSNASPIRTKSTILPDEPRHSPISFPNENVIQAKEGRRRQFHSLADSFQADDSSGIDRYASAFSALNITKSDTSDSEILDNEADDSNLLSD